MTFASKKDRDVLPECFIVHSSATNTVRCDTQASVTKNQALLAECRELEIQLYGKRLELAMAIGMRDDAELWKRAMYDAIASRNSASQGRAAG